MVMTHQMNLTGLSQQTTYHFRVRSTNGSAAATSPDQTFSTMGSNSAPVVSVTSPASGATLSGKVNLTAVASDSGTLTGVQFRVDGGNVGPNLPAEPYLYVLDSSALNTGSHTISAVATDSSGNSTTSSAISVKVDNKTKDTTPPVVTLISPTGGAKVSGTVAVTAIASDNVSVASVQFQLDNANLGPAEAASPYLFSWDSTKTANGTHVLRAIATDSAGNSTTSATVSVTADNTSKDTTPPSVSITAPANGAKVSGVVGVTANATDNVSVASVQFLLDGVNVGPVGLTAPFGYAWDTSKSTNGAHTLTAIATDGAGNAATSRAVTVRVNNPVSDTTPPAVAITSPVGAATVSGSVMIAANATDSVGVASVQFQVDGVNVGGLEGATPYAYTWDTTKVSNGPHRLDAIAKDTAGNTTVSSVVRVTVNNAAAQTFSISGILSGAGGSGATVTLSGTSGAIATANRAGAYTFTGLANGNYTVTPSHTGFTFSPASQAATINAANVTGINFAATAVAPQTFSISGTISGAGGSGATVTLSGTSGATATANGAGAYTFTGLANGNYTVTPSHTGFTFSPASQAATINAANVTGINFAATAVAPQTFSISGTISGAGGSGATVTLSGTSGATATANGAGAYTFTGLANGNYTVTPSHTGFTFSPASQAATINAANVTGINFAATAVAPQTFSISGTISGAGGSGATVTLSGTSGAIATANGAGAYTFTGLANGNYTVTPSHTGFTFSPASQAATINAANVTGINFAATAVAPQTFSISGTISGAGGSGATVTLSGTSGAIATANGAGAYTFTGLANGNYTVTPSHTGFTFSPASQAATINAANVTGINFAATAVAPQTFSISGTISGAGGSGATVTLSGTSGAIATANGAGAYTFTGLANGNYTVTPSHTGFTFSPASQAATINAANVTGINFAATAVAPQTFSISGTISGAGGSGATVTLSGTSGATATANGAGAYTFTGLANGNYTVTPSHTGFTFSPASQAATINAANVTGINFAATAVAPQTFSISGTISGAGGSGATVTLSGTSGAIATANGAGAYTFTGLANGNYTVTPSHTGFTFSPASQAATINAANVTGINFAATAVAPQTFSISGTISGAGGSGATVTLSGTSGAIATANGAGAYTFTGLANGNYTVTPSHTGFTFSPASQAATINAANVTGINFAATAVAPQTFSISGTISGAGGSGATVTLSGTSGAIATANRAGAYTFTGLANGNYTVTPSHTGFTFSPASQAATINAANVTGINFAATAVAPQTFSISGTISGAGGSGATVTLSGTSGAIATANRAGAYTFTGLANGNYTVTPSHTGFTFSPASQAATINAANVTGINFAATAVAPQTFSISGTISDAGGSGATVTLSGTSGAIATANGAGAYTFTGLANGNYTVTPSHTGFTFSPASQAATINAANVTGINFAATAVAPQTFSISGTISGAGGSGATVTLSGTSGATATANGAGAYTFTGLANGNYTVTPSHTGFTFSPASQAATINAANVTGINFAATTVAPQTFSISGTISGAGGSGATVTLSGTSGATATANGAGAYTFTGLANGNYTVTPSHTGFTFSPASQAATINAANVTGINFAATAVAPQTFSISGTISGAGGSGATVILSGAASATTTTNGSGAYTFTD